MALNPAAPEFIPSLSSSPVETTGSEFMAKLDALNNLTLDDLYLESDVSPAQLEELEQADAWIDTQAMLAELEEQEVSHWQ